MDFTPIVRKLIQCVGSHNSNLNLNKRKVAKLINITYSYASMLFTKLNSEGFVRQEKIDGRQYNMSLTDKGKELYKVIIKLKELGMC